VERVFIKFQAGVLSSVIILTNMQNSLLHVKWKITLYVCRIITVYWFCAATNNQWTWNYTLHFPSLPRYKIRLFLKMVIKMSTIILM